MKRLAPRSLLGQLALLILAAFLAAQAISIWLSTDERGAALRAAQRLETVERATAVARALQTAPKASHASILAAANSRLVQFSVDNMPLVETGGHGQTATLDMRTDELPVSPHSGELTEPPAALAWLHERMRVAGVAPVEFRISIPLADGEWLNVAARFQRPDLQAPPAIIGATLLSLALLMAALWFGLRRITTPLSQLASAADKADLGAKLPDVPESSPREVHVLSAALTRMNARLAGLINDRTRMLTALGHDLRSPITALKVRAEMVDDNETRERMIASLDEMQDMVETTLAFARGISTDQPMEKVDLVDMLRDLAEELAATGPGIVVEAERPVITSVRRTPLRRALRNLLENAQFYGGGARVTVCRSDGDAEILIDDFGLGIPPEDLDRVFDPFTRLEASRSRETGGIGLGLPITQAILRAHGGEVVLSNRAGGGLRARVGLPLASGEFKPSRLEEAKK
ncbi:sensor histidine kinase [Halomonas sp. BC04]|uniref:sensor histidine kinase n=1 Tax=Halomonas sp. BC04 TaxID=1403540 RepID=UPI0003ED7B9D|nr:ATP-binding protein [Halomonas sp. BC04]EWG98126.1 histidine kinase [Halomonas sp. BC04]